MALSCPVCKTEHEIVADLVRWVICQGCQHALAQHGQSLIDQGETPSLPTTADPQLKVGSRGYVRGRQFTVIGHLHFGYADEPDEGTWDEWFIQFPDKSVGYITIEGEVEYFHAKRSAAIRPIPPFEELEEGKEIEIEGYTAKVFEAGKWHLLAMAGQLPDHPLPGAQHHYADCKLRNYAISIEYLEGQTMLHFGITLNPGDLEIDQRI